MSAMLHPWTWPGRSMSSKRPMNSCWPMPRRAASMTRTLPARASAPISSVRTRRLGVIAAAKLPGEAAQKFLDVVRQDAAKASAAIRLVLAKPAITSQAIDNLNASIHLRALLDRSLPARRDPQDHRLLKGRATVSMSDLKIGFIGIGAFGSRAAMRLLWSGFPDLMVYDTHEQTPRIFTGTFGGLSLGSPKMVAQLCDIVITCLPSASRNARCLFRLGGPGHWVQGRRSGDGYRHHRSAGNGRRWPRSLAQHDVHLVDAPGFRHARRRKGRASHHGGGRRRQGGGTLPAGAGCPGGARSSGRAPRVRRRPRWRSPTMCGPRGCWRPARQSGWVDISVSSPAIFWMSVMPWAERRWARCFETRSPAAASRPGCSWACCTPMSHWPNGWPAPPA